MKTFTAKQVARSAAQVYRAADIDGAVRINNDRYPDKIFTLTARERGSSDVQICGPGLPITLQEYK